MDSALWRQGTLVCHLRVQNPEDWPREKFLLDADLWKEVDAAFFPKSHWCKILTQFKPMTFDRMKTVLYLVSGRVTLARCGGEAPPRCVTLAAHHDHHHPGCCAVCPQRPPSLTAPPLRMRSS